MLRPFASLHRRRWGAGLGPALPFWTRAVCFACLFLSLGLTVIFYFPPVQLLNVVPSALTLHECPLIVVFLLRSSCLLFACNLRELEGC